MAQFDFPLAELREYRPDVREAPAFDAFWARTLSEQAAATATETPLDNRLVTIDTFDITFTGFDGAPIKAWLHVPAGTCPAYFSVALADVVCPPSTVFPAYNAWGGDKDIEVYPYNNHEGGGDVQTWKQLGWLANH